MSKLPWNNGSGWRELPRSGQASYSPRRARPRAGGRFPAVNITILVLGLLAFLILAPILMYQIVYADKVYLGVRALGIDLGGYTAQQAKAVLSSNFSRYAQSEVIIRYGDSEWRTTPGALGMRFDVEATVKQAMQVGRSGSLPQQILDQLAGLRQGHVVQPVINYDTERQNAVVASLASQVDRPMINASLVTRPEGTVEITASQVGRKVDAAETIRRVQRSLGGVSTAAVELAVIETPPRVVESQLMAAKETAQRILSGPLTIVYDRESITLDIKTLTAMLSFRQEGGNTVAELDEKALREQIVKMAERIDRKPQNARFRFVNGRIELVAESQEGRTVEVGPSIQAIREASLGDLRIVPLVVKTEAPKVQSSDIAKIDIKEKIIEAATRYGDTGLERQHNVRLAMSRLNGVVIPPGETFSFNEALGPTTLKDGYKTAWGIINTPDGPQTVPSEAGGICQVSTTLFHAVFWAGLRIDQRYPHSYWIARYGEKPLGRVGLDSTVDGSGSRDTLDFKFTNNTPHWLAIEAWTDSMNIYFALRGTKPSWTVEIGEPVISNVVKVDKSVIERELDTTLKPGQEVWVETAQDGFDVSITRTVRDGDRVLETYTVKSHYVPARNVIRYNPAPTPGPTPTDQSGAAPTAGPTPTGQPAATPTPPPAPTPTPSR